MQRCRLLLPPAPAPSCHTALWSTQQAQGEAVAGSSPNTFSLARGFCLSSTQLLCNPPTTPLRPGHTSMQLSSRAGPCKLGGAAVPRVAAAPHGAARGAQRSSAACMASSSTPQQGELDVGAVGKYLGAAALQTGLMTGALFSLQQATSVVAGAWGCAGCACPCKAVASTPDDDQPLITSHHIFSLIHAKFFLSCTYTTAHRRHEPARRGRGQHRRQGAGHTVLPSHEHQEQARAAWARCLWPCYLPAHACAPHPLVRTHLNACLRRIFSPLDASRPTIKGERRAMDDKRRPAWMPPPPVFPIVWSSIGLLRCISSVLVW